MHGDGPGRRLILNGHLDTYPINGHLPWTTDPLEAELRDGRLFGRGAADMKGGIAASIAALAALADLRAQWHGEAVLTLAGDEESMGVLGTQWLIEQVPHARGDAAIIGDAGSPSVVRFGEKGFVWLHLSAGGKPSHGAHVHLGINAIDRLRRALDALCGLADLPFEPPASVVTAIESARPVSEPLSGAGEADTLRRITISIGNIAGGTSMNLVPASASAGVDIRLPAGMTTDRILAAIAGCFDRMEGVTWDALRRVEPTVTDPGSEIVRLTTEAARAVIGSARPRTCGSVGPTRGCSADTASPRSSTARHRSTWGAPMSTCW